MCVGFVEEVGVTHEEGERVLGGGNVLGNEAGEVFPRIREGHGVVDRIVRGAVGEREKIEVQRVHQSTLHVLPRLKRM